MVEVYRNGELQAENLQGASSATLSPDGQYLYLVSYQDDAVVVFTRNQTNGRLTYLTAYRNGDIATQRMDDPRSVNNSPDDQGFIADDW